MVFSRKSVLLAAIAAVVAVASAKDSSSVWQKEADLRKADYIYLESLRQNLRDADDASFELVSRAGMLNPSDDYVGWENGIATLRISEGDSAMIEEGMEKMGRYVGNNPSDLYSSVILASLSQRLGKTDQYRSILESLHRHFPERTEITFRYAEVLAGSPDEEVRNQALVLYDSLEVIEGKSIPLSNQKIKLYYSRRDTAEMLREVRNLVASSPSTVEYNVFAGDIYGQFSSRDSALAYYDNALRLDPASGVTYYSRANFFRNLNDSVAYDREVFQALRQPDLDIAPKLEILQGYISDLYTDISQRQRISDLFKVLTGLHPHEPDIYRLYTEYLITIDDYAGAAEQADNALSLDPSDEKGWLRLASLYIRSGNDDMGLDASRRGAHYFPEDAGFPLFEGLSLHRLHRYDEAVGAFRKALELTDSADMPRRSQILTSIGDTYYSADSRDSAYVYYNMALEADPANPTALNNCAYYMANTGQDLDKALEMITLCLDIRPDDPNSLDTFAWVLFRLTRYKEAKDIIDRLLVQEGAIPSPEEETPETRTDETVGDAVGADAPDSPVSGDAGETDDIGGISEELLSHAGDIYFMNGDHKKALEFWKRALEMAPGDKLLQKKVKFRTFFYE